jgi:uncharacterized repeat protein (TIGR03803 family)
MRIHLDAANLGRACGASAAIAILTGCGASLAPISAPSMDAVKSSVPGVPRETTLYRFLGRPDGSEPAAGLIADAAGAFYGTTVRGGAHDDGAVYELTRKGSGYGERLLYSFKGGSDGASPTGSLVVDRTGTLFGTTSLGGELTCTNAGGKGCGTVFALVRAGSGYEKRTLYRFKGYPRDGTSPGTLIADVLGRLYGSTTFGGDGRACSSEGPGCGTIFQLSPSGTGYRERVLHRFGHGSDGLYPTDGLLLDGRGTLYGTTSFGGNSDNGTVFELKPSAHAYAETLLYSFKGRPDGFGPNGGLIADRTGTLYGTTQNGGTGDGTVFALRPGGSAFAEIVLHDFRGHRDGAYPTGGLLARKGVLYGTTGDGGSSRCFHSGCGTVYELKPAGPTERVLYAFKGGRDGQIPLGTLVSDGRGLLYGATGLGGVRGNGTIFSLTP